MKKRVSRIAAAVLLCVSVLSQEACAIEFPDLGELAEEAVSGIADAAGDAGDVISDLTGQAGDIVSGFPSQAGEVLSDWGRHAGETADSVKEKLSDAGVKVITSAEQLGNATAGKASELTKQAGKAADDAINAVSGAADYVLDQAGHVVDLVAAGAGHVSSAAAEAFQVLQESGSLLMETAQEAVAGIDLSKPESWDKAKEKVVEAIESALVSGLLKHGNISGETVKIVTNIVFGAMMYGYQYSNGQITLGEYVSGMSEVLIRNGLPAGVGFVVELLPIPVPNAGSMAKEATYYLISKAYGDEPGDKIEAEEEALLEEESELMNGMP